MLLYPWISLFGVHATAIRSLNYVLILGVISVLWLGLRKLDLVRTARARLLFAALVLCGNGVTFCYRSGRYDCLGMLIISGIFAVAGDQTAPCSIRGGGLAGCAHSLGRSPVDSLHRDVEPAAARASRPGRNSGRCCGCRRGDSWFARSCRILHGTWRLGRFPAALARSSREPGYRSRSASVRAIVAPWLTRARCCSLLRS